MSQIRMSPEQMRGRANEYRTQANNVQEVISKMDTLLQALLSEWEGSSAEAYSARYTELKPSFVKAQTLINEIAASLDSAANQTEELDQGLASQWR